MAITADWRPNWWQPGMPWDTSPTGLGGGANAPADVAGTTGLLEGGGVTAAQQAANRALWEAAYQAGQVSYAAYLNAYNNGYFATPPPAVVTTPNVTGQVGSGGAPTGGTGTNPPAGGGGVNLLAGLLNQANSLGGNTMAVNQEAQGPFTQYLRAIGLGGGGYQNPGQRYQASMYDPYRNLIEGYQGLRTAMGQPSQDWGTAMAGSFQPNRADIQSQYANLLQGLFGMAPAERTLGGFNFEPSYPYGGGGAPDYEGGNKIGYLQDLIAGGTANRFGQGGAGWLASRIPALQQQWELDRAGGTQLNTFLDFVKQKYSI